MGGEVSNTWQQSATHLSTPERLPSSYYKLSYIIKTALTWQKGQAGIICGVAITVRVQHSAVSRLVIADQRAQSAVREQYLPLRGWSILTSARTITVRVQHSAVSRLIISDQRALAVREQSLLLRGWSDDQCTPNRRYEYNTLPSRPLTV